MDLPLPGFYEPGRVGEVYLERAALVAEAAARYRSEHQVPPAAEDGTRIAAFGIDCQVAFCHPGASLFVPGAVEDTRRAVEWLYRNLHRLTTLVFSLDTHTAFQIFHPMAWVDPEGRHPAPFTVIAAKDVRAGRWIPILRDETFRDPVPVCLEYCERLESTGRYVLTIWPYHALLGGASHVLVPALMEAALFHSFVRVTDAVVEIKGRARFTENFSVLSPEVQELAGTRIGAFHEGLYEKLMAYDRLYVFGQAKSHCVLSTLEDLLHECRRRDPRLLQRIWILEDAMSPVPPPPLDPLPEALDFPKVAERAISELREAGMHVVRTTDPV